LGADVRGVDTDVQHLPPVADRPQPNVTVEASVQFSESSSNSSGVCP
jgi:hypothetical protein